MNNNQLKEWIENLFDGKVNSISILIKGSNLNYKQLLFNIEKNLKLNILDENFMIRNSSKNSIVFTTNITFNNQELFNYHMIKGFIFIEDKESIENLIKIIQTKDFFYIDKIKYSVVTSINLGTLLTIDKNDLQRIIVEREHILKTINEQYIRLNQGELLYFLDIYFSKNILIASFAQRLFRLATLNFTSSEKRVGGYLREALNTSSKVVCETHLGIIKNPKKISNIRVYDLNVNQVEENIKIKIAKELLALSLKELDIIRITKITDLPLITVENLYKSVYLK